MTQTTLEQAIAERDAAIEQVEKHAGEEFREQAKAFILDYLRRHGEQPGEILTDKCKEAGIVPANGDKAFGAVYCALSRRGLIHKVGTCLRRNGHGTSGGNVWGLVERREL
jgi:hypothetical protein